MVALLLFLFGQGLLLVGAYLLKGVFGWHVALGFLALSEGIVTVFLAVANVSADQSHGGRSWYE